MKTFNFRAQKNWARWGDIEIFAWSTKEGQRVIIKDVVLEVVGEGVSAESNIFLDPTQAQALMDDLWNCGIRPTEGHGSAGSLAATERHLKDLQRLVFKDKKP